MQSEQTLTAPATLMKPRSSATSGVMWAGVSQAGRILLQLLATAALSRLLPPTDFGLLAMATIVVNFANLLRDMGTSAAVIQRATLSEELLDSVFWFNIGLGICLAVSVLILAAPVAIFFRESRLAGVLLALAISFPLTSSGLVHQALLERGLHFRQLARIELSSAGVALFIAVIAARAGLGVYSLVLNTVSLALFTTVQLWVASQWRPSLRWSAGELRSLWQFSSNLFGSQTLTYFTRNIDTMLIGRFLGALQLGWYNTAYRIMLFPVTNLSSVIARVLFPVLSRQQDNAAAFNSLYLRALSGIALITAPIMGGIWATRIQFVQVVLGERWLPVANVIAWLAPAGMLQAVGTTVGLIGMSTGNTPVMMRWSIVVFISTATSILIGLPAGYVGVARSYAIQNFIMFLPSFAVALHLVDLRLKHLLQAVGRQFLAAALMAIAVYAIGLLLPASWPALLKLALLVPIGAVIYFLLVWIFMRSAVLDVIGALRLRRR